MSNQNKQTPMQIDNQQKLKTQISEHILEHIANSLDMTVSEYGSVYNSELHENLLNKIMTEIKPLLHQLETEVRGNERNRIIEQVGELEIPLDEDGNYAYDPMCEVNQLLQEIRAIVWDKRTVHEKPENEPSSVENTDDIPF